MKKFKNCVVVDGKIRGETKYQGDRVSFNLSIITGTWNIDNRRLNRYTMIRVVYFGDVDPCVENLLSENSMIRIYGRLDSEQYIDRNGKRVYNKILEAEKITEIPNEVQERN